MTLPSLVTWTVTAATLQIVTQNLYQLQVDLRMRFDTLQTPAGSGKLSDRQSYIKFIETYYFRKFVNNVLTLKQYDFLL